MSRVSLHEMVAKMNDINRDILAFSSAGDASKIRDDSFEMLELVEEVFKKGLLTKASRQRLVNLHYELMDELKKINDCLLEFSEFGDVVVKESRNYLSR